MTTAAAAADNDDDDNDDDDVRSANRRWGFPSICFKR
jgi:hypothetical protein